MKRDYFMNRRNLIKNILREGLNLVKKPRGHQIQRYLNIDDAVDVLNVLGDHFSSAYNLNIKWDEYNENPDSKSFSFIIPGTDYFFDFFLSDDGKITVILSGVIIFNGNRDSENVDGFDYDGPMDSDAPHVILDNFHDLARRFNITL